jgi:hypothetical protein
MIQISTFTLLVMKILISIIAGVFWHGLYEIVYEFSWIGSMAYILALMTLGLTFIFIPLSRPVIRSVFDAYSWIFDFYFPIITSITCLTSLLLRLNIVEGITWSLKSPYHIHVWFVCLLINENCFKKIKSYYMNRNLNQEAKEKNAIIFDDGVCSICLGPHVNASRPRCGHTYCYSCLWSWIQVKSTCPLCKEQIIPSAIKSEQKPKDDFPFNSPLFNFNIDEDEQLHQELLEIGNSINVYTHKLFSTLVFCLCCLAPFLVLDLHTFQDLHKLASTLVFCFFCVVVPNVFDFLQPATGN